MLLVTTVCWGRLVRAKKIWLPICWACSWAEQVQRVILFSLKYLVNIKRKRALELDRSYLSIFIYIFKEHWRNQATKRSAFHQPGNRNKLVFNSVVWKLWWMLCKTVQTECLCSSSRSFSGQKERHFVWNSHEVVCYYIRIGTVGSN